MFITKGITKKLIAKAEKYSIEVYHVMSHIGVGGQFEFVTKCDRGWVGV